MTFIQFLFYIMPLYLVDTHWFHHPYLHSDNIWILFYFCQDIGLMAVWYLYSGNLFQFRCKFRVLPRQWDLFFTLTLLSGSLMLFNIKCYYVVFLSYHKENFYWYEWTQQVWPTAPTSWLASNEWHKCFCSSFTWWRSTGLKYWMKVCCK